MMNQSENYVYLAILWSLLFKVANPRSKTDMIRVPLENVSLHVKLMNMLFVIH